MALDCFASLAMTVERHESIFPRRISPELCIIDHPRKSEGTGKAGWPLHPGPPRKRIARKRVDHRYRRRHSGLPCAVVYGLFRALLGEPMLVCHRRLASAFGANARLSASVGAPGPHDFAVRECAARQSARFPSTAFRSTFVTTRTPLVGTERSDHTIDSRF
jgi:hypothetical protein